MSVPSETGAALACAIAHEVGNHLGGIRLQAHLLDEDLDARELAEASILIDDLAGRAGPLLSLLRPLLLSEGQRAADTSWARVLSGLRQQIEDQGTRGADFEVAIPEDGDAQAATYGWLHPLLMALVEATLAHVGREGSVRVSLCGDAGRDGSVLRIEDDGPKEELSDKAAQRGRPLAYAIARELVSRTGGRVQANRDGDRTRVDLVFSA